MLKIFNNLEPFCEDCYRRYSVREYARVINVSPPTASKILKQLSKEKLLKKELFRNYMFFWANNENRDFIELSRLYWRQKLSELKLSIYFKTKIMNPMIILFGSLSKAENKVDSDLDIAVFGMEKKSDIKLLEKKLKREIQIFEFNSLNGVKNKELMNNILNGIVLVGYWRL